MDQRNFMFMFWGFAVAWLVLMVYTLTLAARGRRIREELKRLKAE